MHRKKIEKRNNRDKLFLDNNMLEHKLEMGDKCGDIFFRNDIEQFLLICNLCDLNFQHLNTFSHHFLNEHLQEVNKRNVEIKIENIELTFAEEKLENSNASFFDSEANDEIVKTEGEFLQNINERDCENNMNSPCDMSFENDDVDGQSFNEVDDMIVENELKNNSKDSLLSDNNSCPFCLKSFDSLTEFQEHRREANCSDLCEMYIGHLGQNDSGSENNSSMKYKSKYRHSKSSIQKHLSKSIKLKKEKNSKGRKKFSKEELTCQICSRELPNISSLIRHKKSHIENSKRPFKCKVCSKGFNTVGHLEKHSKIHNDPRIYECDLCFLKFNSIISKNEHQRSHTVEFRQLVGKIGKKLAVIQQIKNGNSENLVLEINYSVPDGYWRCEICDKMFKNSYKQEEHNRFHSELKPFMCELCGKGMATQQALNHHILVHKEERRFKCLKCERSFFASAHLRRHEQTSCNSEKLFQCEICQFKFTRKEHLSAHFLTHKKNRTKDYKCDYCNATYLTSNALRVHKKKHLVTTSSPFKCNLCDAVFTNKEALKRHERRHQNKGAFKCEHCEKRFNDKDDVQQHAKRQHFSELKPYSCALCNETFIKKSDLKEHFTTHNTLS